jgi:hypothetical protein
MVSVATSRKPLSRGEILELDAALIEAFAALRRLRTQRPAAAAIKFPAIPSVLSESVVAHLAPRLFGASGSAIYGGRSSDLQVDVDGVTPLDIEVKATGEGGFQEIKQKDLLCDALVWVDFGRRYADGEGEAVIYVLRDPRKFFQRPTRIVLRGFLARVGDSPLFVSYRYDIKADRLAEAAAR